MHISDEVVASKKLSITRPKLTYGRQGLEWVGQVRIQFRRVHFGVDTFRENIYFWKKIPDLGFLGL